MKKYSTCHRTVKPYFKVVINVTNYFSSKKGNELPQKPVVILISLIIEALKILTSNSCQ